MTRLMIVKFWVFALLAGLLLTGCASTRSTVESRKKERAGAYASFPAETKALVDQGKIKVGMPMDGVYIAWGNPAQVLENETGQGAATVWLYEGGWMEEMRWWPYYGRTPISDYQPRTYVRAEIVFVNGVVQSWRTLPQPRY